MNGERLQLTIVVQGEPITQHFPLWMRNCFPISTPHVRHSSGSSGYRPTDLNQPDTVPQRSRIRDFANDPVISDDATFVATRIGHALRLTKAVPFNAVYSAPSLAAQLTTAAIVKTADNDVKIQISPELADYMEFYENFPNPLKHNELNKLVATDDRKAYELGIEELRHEWTHNTEPVEFYERVEDNILQLIDKAAKDPMKLSRSLLVVCGALTTDAILRALLKCKQESDDLCREDASALDARYRPLSVLRLEHCADSDHWTLAPRLPHFINRSRTTALPPEFQQPCDEYPPPLVTTDGAKH